MKSFPDLKPGRPAGKHGVHVMDLAPLELRSDPGDEIRAVGMEKQKQ